MIPEQKHPRKPIAEEEYNHIKKNHQSSHMEAPKSAHFWADDESELMLTLLKKLNIFKYLDGRKTRNGNLFKKVAEQMKESGFMRTPEQVRIRWKHLKKNYYQARKNNGTSGHNRVACPFGDALDELLGSKPLPQVEHHGVDIGSETPLGSSQRLSGRRHHVANLDTVLERMERYQATWMQQMQQSQDREERLVNSIIDSNSKMVAAVMEGIRIFQQSLAPPSTHTENGYQEQEKYTPVIKVEVKQE